jgi:hypothetical protein
MGRIRGRATTANADRGSARYSRRRPHNAGSRYSVTASDSGHVATQEGMPGGNTKGFIMGSFLISSNVNHHPLVVQMTPDGWCMWIHAVGYISRSECVDVPAEWLTTTPCTEPNAVAAHLVDIGAFLPVDGGFRVALPPDLVQLPFRAESERNPNGFQTTSARIPNDCARGHVARLHRRTP